MLRFASSLFYMLPNFRFLLCSHILRRVDTIAPTAKAVKKGTCQSVMIPEASLNRRIFAGKSNSPPQKLSGRKCGVTNNTVNPIPATKVIHLTLRVAISASGG
ncbi:MAG: hypothetical protein ABSD49_05015 [Candidatus Bathyarchaeia archaeon]